jgi:hypothetical protein
MTAPPGTKYCPDCCDHRRVSEFHKSSRTGQATYCKRHWRARYGRDTVNPQNDAIRGWAEREGLKVPRRGPLPDAVIDQWKAAHGGSHDAQPQRPTAPAPPRSPPGSATGYAEIYGLTRCPNCGSLYAGSQCYRCTARVIGFFQQLREMGQ